MLPASLQDEVPILIDIYEELWRSNAPVHLPDTVVWRHSRVESWFFTSRETQHPVIKKKRVHTMHNPEIMQHVLHCFGKPLHLRDGSNPSEIVARWIGGPTDGSPCNILHLTKDSLKEFVTTVHEKGTGVLQRFVPHAGPSYSLRADWNPHFLSVEGRTNENAVGDTRVVLAERYATFEGPCRSTRVAGVNNHLRKEVERISSIITSSIENLVLPAHKVCRLQLTFVHDDRGCVWLSWC